MTVAVCLPWRDTREPERRAAFDLVRARWEHYGYPVMVGDCPATFNRAAARNAAAAQADGADVLIFCDADTTFTDVEDVEMAVSRAYAPRWAQTRTYWAMVRGWWPESIEGVWPVPADDAWKYRYTDSPGGIQVVPRDALQMVGGWDPRFRGWGFEDDAFCHAMTAACGAGVRCIDVVHLWHPTPRAARFGQPHYRQNRKLARRYEEADGLSAIRSVRGV